MKALDDTIAALGEPVFLRTFGAEGAARAAVGRWRHEAGVVEVAPSDTIRLAMSLLDRPNARARGGSAASQGGSVSVFSPSEGAVVELNGPADVVQLYLDQGAVEAGLDRPLAWAPMFGLRDDALRASMLKVLVGSARQGPDDALMVEEHLQDVVERVAKHAAHRRGRSAALFRGGLAPAARRRVEDLIAHALDEGASLGLHDMASAAGLSVSHFVRAFRGQVGETPHRHLVRRRLQRAIALLREPATPVAEVADRTGFATPAHFVASFRAAMGVTPGALRDGLAR